MKNLHDFTLMAILVSAISLVAVSGSTLAQSSLNYWIEVDVISGKGGADLNKLSLSFHSGSILCDRQFIQ